MKFLVNLNPKDNLDELGEMLRKEFFAEEYDIFGGEKYRKLGCYSVFEVKADVVPLPDEAIDKEYPEDGNYHVFSKIIDKEIVIMKYYWDGDGTLEFHFNNGSCLVNDDCKKDYVWKYYENGLPEFDL
jgi:hypothetical protein